MIAAIVLALLQEPAPPAREVALAWKCAEGQRFAVGWKASAFMKVVAEKKEVGSFDFTSAVEGKLSIASVPRVGKAECLLSIRRQEVRGTMMRWPIHILLEDGEIKRSVGADKNLDDLPTIANKPIWFKLSPDGRFDLEGSKEAQDFFATMDDLAGPRLPPGPVKVGDSWDGAPGLRSSKKFSLSKVAGTYKLAGIRRAEGVECARITMEVDREVPDQGVQIRHEVKREFLFDIENGRCLRGALSWRMSGAGIMAGEQGSLDLKISFEFDLKPIEKK